MTRALPGRERWPPIAEVLDGALELAPEARPAFLDRVCAGRVGLRADIEAFLHADSRAGNFLAPPSASTWKLCSTARSRPRPAVCRRGGGSVPTR